MAFLLEGCERGPHAVGGADSELIHDLPYRGRRAAAPYYSGYEVVYHLLSIGQFLAHADLTSSLPSRGLCARATLGGVLVGWQVS